MKGARDSDRKNAFLRAFYSIRTRYSLATAAFLLLALSIFYVGGRIVLVHLMREAEEQVKEIGYDISRLAYRQADAVKHANGRNIAEMVRDAAAGATPESQLAVAGRDAVSLVLDFDKDGAFAGGALRRAGEVVPVAAADIAAYATRFADWMRLADTTNEQTAAVGLVQIRDAAHYVFLAPYEGDRKGYLVIGSSFDSSVFTSRVNEDFAGLNVRVVNRRTSVTVGMMPSGVLRTSPNGGERNSFGLVPMLSEALNFYSGGFWNLGSNPFEAVFAVRDIAGNAVTMITVSLPASLANVTRSALGRFTFFIAMTGIVLIIPIFWFQGYVLLNPLTRMTKSIRLLGQYHEDADCPRLEWDGHDEFAMLAASVNQMLETISRRSINVAQVEARHRALLAGVPDALAVFDRRGRLVSVTKQPEGTPPLPGFTVGEPPSADVYGAENSEAFVRALESVFESKALAAVRLEAQREPGVSRDVPTRHFEVRLARMDEVFALAIVRDVSKEVAEHKLRLAAEARARDASKRESLTLLAAGIAHDVNNVLSVILNTVEAADAGSGKVEVDVIRDAVQRGSRMTKELMTFAGDSKVSLLRASPDFFVRDVQSLTSRVVGKDIAIVYRLAEGLPDVDADPNQFWKVLFNIVKNAGEALGDGPGQIVISTEAFEMTDELSEEFMSESPLPPGPGVLFRVSDNGPGIPPAILSRIFDPYVSSKTIGRGLGLATVRTIVETHGGGLKVESIQGVGTTFSIFLPQSNLPAAESVVTEAKRPAPGTLPAEVLVVDDDEAILKTLSILLKSLGVVARVARDRSSALAVMRRPAAGLGAVLMDAHLVGADVVRLFEAFRIASRDIPIIVLSGSSEESVREIFCGCSYNAFLGKPFTLDELREVLLKATEREA